MIRCWKGADTMLQELYIRQSIRKYKNQPIEDEKLEEVLRAGMNAPCAKQMQNTQYMIVTNREALNDMVTLQPFMGMMREAPCAILVLAKRQENEYDDYLYVNAAASIENILIEAVHQGLSTCWCAIGPSPERISNFRNYYNIAEDLIPIASIAIGYGNETKEKVDRYDPQKISYYR